MNNIQHPDDSNPLSPAPIGSGARGEGKKPSTSEVITILMLLALALLLRLLIWHWHDQYPLGGDEREYLDQALLLLQERRYVELRLMRPPLYTGFLAASIYLFDSLIQNLRFVQAIVSTLTVIPAYGLARVLFGPRTAAIAGLLVALNYTLAASATEILTETLFIGGLTTLLWVLAAIAQRPRTPWLPILAGLILGALTLIRSVALPLLPLGALWLLLHPTSSDSMNIGPISGRTYRIRPYATCLFLIASLLMITPWTIRNYVTYGGLIIIDTTGAENVWLDNDPAGREAVKRELYAMGEDRVGRQQIATQRGIAAITNNPARFFNKAWAETTKFFALQQFDDLRDRPAIWVSPLETWIRLLLGDATWLLLLLAGTIGLWLAPRSPFDMRWILAPWAIYTLFTAIIFHVELRYRLPLYPALLPYGAWLLASLSRIPYSREILRLSPLSRSGRGGQGVRAIAALATLIILIILTSLHRPYLQESGMLIAKHIAIWQAEQALGRADIAAARNAAGAALLNDDRSVLARVALARADLLEQQPTAALKQLLDAEQAIAAHPHAHLLRGAILLNQGDTQAARAELAYETASLEDLQDWAWRIFPPIIAPPTHITIGSGLDLGHIRGFYPAETGGFRWAHETAEIRLAAPQKPATINLHIAPGRSSGIAPVELTIRVAGSTKRVLLQPGWQTISIPINPASSNSDHTDAIIIQLTSPTFRPRDADRTSPDNRNLGIMVAWAEIIAQ